MQRKAYVSGVATLLAALLAGCTGGSGESGESDNANPGDAGTATTAAEPGRYRTLPEPCGVIGEDTLDSLLPGIQEMPDEQQRVQAYEGEATLTYDTDRKVGCRWKVESATATDHLLVDFERVVSYDTAVSDAGQAEQLFAAKQDAADLPEPTSTPTASDTPSSPPPPSSSPSTTPSSSTSATTSTSPSPSTSPTDLQPRTLDGLGDEAFLDDALSGSGSTAQQRTVTVAFRTSNVIVTIAYEEQPGTVGAVPDSEDMQDKARNLAARLADSLSG
ncbi:DUF3558 domain-containing protein [Streptomyces sp. NPDC048290]|uniref:DUF3558 domain-containing protein n=1 Tax=Streptomyces sp. NPDC048290 TaxID=3155811 RepID=UPI00343D70B6